MIEQHCADVGRDPAEITKTRLGSLVIGATEAEADAKLGDFAAGRKLTREQARAFATVGGPESVAEQAQAFLDAGLDGLLFNMIGCAGSRARAPRGRRVGAPLRLMRGSHLS